MAFVYPQSQELTFLGRENERSLKENRAIFDIMAIRNVDSSLVRWEIEENIQGLQQLRGLGGSPMAVGGVGSSIYTLEPGAYGEYIAIDEVELTERRRLGLGDQAVNIDDLVVRADEKLQIRELDRIEWVGWQALQGSYNVLDQGGSVKFSDTFAVQTASAAVSWQTYATATPLADLRAVSILGRGKGASFGGAATAYMNSKQANDLLLNTNDADLHGKRKGTGSTLDGITDVNKITLGAALPSIVVYDGGHYDPAGTWTSFIPDNKVIIIGKRSSGRPVLEYLKTRNANTPNMAPGSYAKVVDHGETEVPRRIDVHRGHNGAPAIYFPSAVVVLST